MVNNNAVTKPAGHSLAIMRQPGEDVSRTLARSALDPASEAACTLARINSSLPELDVNAFVAELQEQAREARAGNLSRSESMLVAHAHTLDALFHAMICQSLNNAGAGYPQAAETYMRLFVLC